jgi:hypothetical protein
MNQHWTARSTEDFVYRISSDFALQIENKMDEGPVTQSELADRLDVTPGRVCQVLRNPGNLTLRKMVEYAASLGMKVSVVAYEDGDPQNQNGPINSEIFNACWKKLGKPADFFALSECVSVARNTPSIRYVSPVKRLIEDQTSDSTMLLDLVVREKKNTTFSMFPGER